MMTFYLGDESTLYKKKFKEIKDHYKPDVKTGSNSEIFRHIVDVLYTEITRVKRETIGDIVGIREGIAELKNGKKEEELIPVEYGYKTFTRTPLKDKIDAFDEKEGK